MHSRTAFDRILRQATVAGRVAAADIGIRDGRIAAIETHLPADAPEVRADGRLVLPGFVDTHIHLDKACLLGRCGHDHSSLASAIKAVSELKRGFTVEDVYQRGARVLEKAILKGTTHMRTHVEVDPRVGLRSFEAIRQLKRDYAWAIDLAICVFPQEGLTNDPGAEDLLVAALRAGADVLGGCPYTDSDPKAQIDRLFDLAVQFGVDLDFHLDFDLDPTWMLLDDVCEQTLRHSYQGRVAIGHVTKLSALPPAAFDRVADRLAQAGVAVTGLPATDLYLMGRDATHNAPRGLALLHKLVRRGVCCSVATNNVLNPFTPFGDGSLLRMANLYANVAHVSPLDFDLCVDLVTTLPARLTNLTDYGLASGKPATFIVVEAETRAAALAEIADVAFAFRNGVQTFSRAPAELFDTKERHQPALRSEKLRR
ncbi:amidohydrolase family protein [Bradyrhizobium sp. LHD-71]|uniref:amidohydrolase family protein n=1 Tax=Bradyrhizobium sp. LHD-71 TaxID=3072141 RepID=UPI00280C4722|nr:amidohydrolase family protein [Bradyrhizobium sp. LHD-71]MDQ8730470.1 amidohydrolase family protein [Bradyrhizobium sp. LHD-71]